jgi:hypothetical protein
LVDEENRPEIEIVYPNLTAEELKYKSSSAVTGPKLENIQGHIINSTSTEKIEARQDLKNKLK